MHVRPTRLAAGTLVLALPLVAAAGCGVAKKRTVKQELSAAQQNLADSKAASFTLHLDDAKGSIAKAATADGSLPEAAAKDLVGSSITVTLDPASARQIKAVKKDASESELKTDLAKARLSLQVKDATATVAELRLVDSALWVRVDLSEIDRLAKEAGQDGVAQQVDDFIASAPAEYRPALKDAKAGKWMKLPLSDYLGSLKDLTSSLPTPAATSASRDRIGKDVFAAVKPYVKVTDANDSSSKRVLDVRVDVRGAAKALLGVAKGSKDLPFGDALGAVTPAQVDSHVRAGTAHGTVTLSDGHLEQVTVDLGSIEALDATAKDRSTLTGSRLVLDVDDSADEVTAPTSNVSDVDVKALVDDLFQGVTQRFGAGLSGDVSS
jgi:hypothetical protein